MKKLWLGILFGVVLLVGILVVNAETTTSLCYQESANTSNQTGIDGDCGLDYSGSYGSVSNWHPSFPIGNAWNGNWNDYVAIDGFDYHPPNIIYSNYTKPTNSLPSSLWQVKWKNNTVNPDITNFSLPSDCWNESPLQIGYFITGPANGTFECYDGIAWETLSSNINGHNFYEEAMWWNVSTTLPSNILIAGTNNHLKIGNSRFKIVG